MHRHLVLALLLVVVRPAPAGAWGFEAHRFVMDRAIALLPEVLRPMFEKHRALAVERAIDPDTWRTAGFDEEAPNHFAFSVRKVNSFLSTALHRGQGHAEGP